ncbi:MAG: hypothetical protein IIA75_09310 [Proteobacteria bacterium]|nr:hypothetical protein [Pseudomonadota bacterium]
MATQSPIANFLNPVLFSIYIIALFVMPLPLGSNRDWAWPFFTVVFCFLAIVLIAMRGVAFGCLMGTVSLLIHSGADFNLQIPSNAALFVLLLALPQAMEKHMRVSNLF